MGNETRYRVLGSVPDDILPLVSDCQFAVKAEVYESDGTLHTLYGKGTLEIHKDKLIVQHPYLSQHLTARRVESYTLAKRGDEKLAYLNWIEEVK